MAIATCDQHARHKAGCPDCKARSAQRGRDRHRAITYGIYRGLQDVEPARRHAQWLHSEHGMSCRRIAEKAGVGKERVRLLLNGDLGKIQPVTFDRIMATRPDGETRDTDLVPAVGTARRLQALTAMGHHIDKIAAEAGVRPQAIARWRRLFRPTILASTDRTVRAVYGRLANVDGGDDETRAYARTQSYAPPGAWDSDDDMDNPDVQPDLDAVRDHTGDVLAGVRPVTALTTGERRRVVEYLIALGYTDRQISERLQWQGGRKAVARYRAYNELPPGASRLGGKSSKWAREQRRLRYRSLSAEERWAAIERFDFPGELAEDVARAVGCSRSTVTRHRGVKAAARDKGVDANAVERVLAGRMPFSALNAAERVALFEQYSGTWSVAQATRTLRISGKTYRRWMNELDGIGNAA